MSWIDRLQQAAWTTPGGQARVVFLYEDVSRSITKKTTAYSFPNADGVYIQDGGDTGAKYPIRAFFAGADCDQLATNFENALRVRGVGTLEHPIYGTVNAVAFGDITRRDDLKTAANQSIVEVTFWESSDFAYPSNQTDPAASADKSVAAFTTAAGDQFGNVNLIDRGDSAAVRFKNRYLRGIQAVRDTLRPIAAKTDDVRQAFDTIADSIELSIDVLIGDPAVLAAQTLALIHLPSQAAASAQAKLEGYAALFASISSADTQGETAYLAASIFASGSVSGAVLSLTSTELTTKPEAMSAASFLLDLNAALTVWQDDTNPGIDTGETYQPLQQAVAIAAGFAVDISFTVLNEIIVVTDRPRNFLEMSAEVYGDISDDTLNKFITTNNLTGSEIIEIPRGRTIVFYL